MRKPAYYNIEFVSKNDGRNFSDDILHEYDEAVKTQIADMVTNGEDAGEMYKMLSSAAYSRAELADFLECRAHGPH